MKVLLLSRAFLAVGFCASLAIPVLAQDAVGIPVCDAFLTKYDACMKNQPAAQKAQFDQMMTQMRTSWKQMAANPQSKPALETACKQITDQMKTQLNAAPYNCGF
ncbi:MAG: hypothetical protein ACRCWF_00875 [Beijerinckiaceae bacterium]